MLELKSISKSFPGVKALDNVSLKFEPGDIHALIGENGAGKSTLIKIITGIYQPDKGEIYFNNNKLHFSNYCESLDAGIDIVSQEIQVVSEASIAENIMLDKMITYGKSGIINWKAVNNYAKKYMDMVGLRLPPTTEVKSLSAANKQLIQIAKALAANATVLLLDEPTSSLTAHETKNLFSILRGLQKKKVTIIFVSHKFEEVFELCNKVSVLRDGAHVGTKLTSKIKEKELIKMMIGREIKEEHLGMLDIDRKKEVLKVENIFRKDKVEDINFTLHQGEILGFYGLVGAGRTELARILIGEDKADSGQYYVNGKRVVIRSVGESLYKYKLGYITENRKEEGLFLDSSISTNITITVWKQIINRLTGYISWDKERKIGRNMINSIDIRCRGLSQITESLSGGNQQKVSISKWLAADCDILIIDEPTVGVDIGAKEQIHQLIWNLAKKEKKSIILISSDMPEIIKISSRILVFRERRIVGQIKDIDTKGKTYKEVSTGIGKYLH